MFVRTIRRGSEAKDFKRPPQPESSVVRSANRRHWEVIERLICPHRQAVNMGLDRNDGTTKVSRPWSADREKL
jgi:hypothetical protein